jgi:iron complex outermembrane recepter protein
VRSRNWLYAGAALLALPAAAQDAPVAEALPEAADAGTGIADIVVTATRRSETAISVPISITALDQTTLDRQGIRDIRELSRLTPGLALVPSGPGFQVAIRGITSLAGASTTGIYIDDTPIQTRNTSQGASPSVFPRVFDLERVEVLRGPQGTLFGAGSEGGTLRFITPSPSLTRASGYGRAEVGFTDQGTPSYEAGIAAGVPLVEDKLGLRASVWTRHDGGYVDRINFFNGQLTDKNANTTQSLVARLAAVFQPAENLRITPSIYYQDVDQDDADTIWRDAGDYRSYFDIPQPTREQFLLPSLSIDYDFGPVAFKSITSRFIRDQTGINRFFHSFAQGCPPGGQAPGYPADRCGLLYPQIPNYTLLDHVEVKQRNWSQEVRLTSTNDSRLSWVVGLFYQNNKQTYYEDEDEPLLGQLTQLLFGLSVYDFAEVGTDLIDGRYAFIQNTTQRDEEIAGFGDFTYAVTDRLKATVGLRYSRTSFRFNDRSDGPLGALSTGPLVTSGRATEKPFTPKFSISYDPGQGTIYATVAKGYRQGGANGILPNFCAAQLATLGIEGAPPPYKSDTVWSYEIGAKKRFGRTFEIAGSAYQIDWNGIQGSIPLNSCSYSFISNFGKARVRGFDLQLQVSPVEGLRLGGTVAYNDGQYRETIPQPNSTTLLAQDGAPIPFLPKWQATASAEYQRPIGRDMQGYLRADYRYTGEYFRNNPPGVIGFLASNRNGAAIDDLALRGGVTFDRFDVSLFAKNVFNNTTPLTQTYSTRLGTYGARAERYTILRPRTIGLTGVVRY